MQDRGSDGHGIGTLDMGNIKSSLTFDASAPEPLLRLYYSSLHQHMDDGKEDEEAHARAIREIQRAGWFKGKNGWKQVLPDLRDKIKVIEGVRQPDGKYFIEGVPVFHPNNAKGVPFDVDKIRQRIKNTNAHIVAGGAKPVLIEGHPSDLQEMAGKQLDSCGHAINYREEDPVNKPGHVIADFIGVEPEYYKRMQEKKLPHLSAGFAKDAAGLGGRFGHVALLGGTSPGLSYLPAADYFSASGNYICFSAEPEFFPERKNHMLSEKQKQCFAAMHSAKEAYDAAEVSNSVNEPGAAGKMAEAFTAMKKSCDEFAAAMGEGGGPAGNVVQDEEAPATIGNGAAAGEYGNLTNAQMPNPATVSPAPESEMAPESFAAIVDRIDLNDPSQPNAVEETFSALIKHGKRMENEIDILKKTNAELVKSNRVARIREVSEQFHSKIGQFRREGRVGIPDAAGAKEDFDSIWDSADPIKAMNLILKRYERLPKAATPGTVNKGEPIFSAAGDNGQNPLANTKPLPVANREPKRAAVTQSLTNQTDPDAEVFAAIADRLGEEFWK